MESRGLPRVVVFSLGGTISSTGYGGSGVLPTLTGEDLIRDVPQISEAAEVEAVSFRQAASSELEIEDLVELSGEVEESLGAGASGVVVTQGTDTIEETSFALDLLVDREAPVLVTGAMRNPTLPGADGPANLLAAVRVASSEEVRGLGALVVMNDEVHAARLVKKTHTQSPATFHSPGCGPVGWVSEGEVRVMTRPVDGPKVPRLEPPRQSPVALLKMSLGDDGRMLQEIENLGYEGLVVEAMGGGHVPSIVVERLEELARKMPVVLASRTGSGEVLGKTYGFPGSETDLLARGLVSARYLDGLKARISLSLLLAGGASCEEVFRFFEAL